MMHAAVRSKHEAGARKHLERAGYKVGGPVESADDKRADIKRVKSAIDQHDDQLHGGKKTHLKLRRRGGRVEGEKPMHDMARRARGGAMPKGKGNINIILETGARDAEKKAAMQKGLQIGTQMGAKAAAAKMGAPAGGMPQPRPPMGGAPGPMGAGAPPPRPAMPGPMPAGGALKDGGAVKVKEHIRRRHAAERAYR